MSVPEYQVLGGLWGNRLCKISSLNLQKMKLRELVRVPTVSDWAKFAVQISKDEAPTPLRLSNFAELRTNDIAGSSKQ